MILFILKGSCVLLTGFLCGSTLYSSLVEIPVRQRMNEEGQIQNWRLVFEKAHGLSKVSGLIACILSLMIWYFTSNILWMVCSCTLFVILPYTTLLMSKINDALLQSESSIGLSVYIRKWDKLHHGRTFLCLISFIIAISASLS